MGKVGNPNAAEDGKKGGRPKGSKDKISRDVKTRIMDVWNQLEKEGKGLLDEAQTKPDWFYVNFVKGMIPKDMIVAGDQDNPLRTKVTVEFVEPKNTDSV